MAYSIFGTITYTVASLSNEQSSAWQENYRSQLEPMLHQFVIPAFSSKYGHLRAKACWVSGRFADIDFKDGTGHGPTFTTFFTMAVKALQDPDLPVSSSA